jgi:hypothetical protein
MRRVARALPAALPRRPAPATWAVALCVIAGANGCVKSVGPIVVRIETDGPPIDDFVLEWSDVLGGVHGSDYRLIERRVVASGAPIELPRRTLSFRVTEISVSLYHPSFALETAGSEARGGELALRPLRPARLDGIESLTLQQLQAHVERIQHVWLPALGGASALRPHLPLLAAAVARAQFVPDSRRGWFDERSVREELVQRIESLAGVRP